MEVFRLSALRNRWKPKGALGPDGEVIPENIIIKPPSAELRENQKDEDSLPPYPVLDGILRGLVEKEMRVADIVADGYDLETVRRVERLLYLAEYKPRLAARGVRVGPKIGARDRRYPIVNRFRDQGNVAQMPDASIAPVKSAGISERFEE
jgi:NAD+ synthase